MDGVADLPVPTFVIALTNRRELVDNAILRPGRLEVHVGVGKPDEKGRAKILKIHADTMRESGRLGLSGSGGSAGSGGDGGECVLERVDDSTYDAWVESLAAKTDGFSGAALAAIVRAAVARALDRSVTMNDTQGCRVTDDDFDYAVEDLRTSSLELEDGPAFYEYGDESGEDRAGGRPPAAGGDGDVDESACGVVASGLLGFMIESAEGAAAPPVDLTRGPWYRTRQNHQRCKTRLSQLSVPPPHVDPPPSDVLQRLRFGAMNVFWLFFGVLFLTMQSLSLDCDTGMETFAGIAYLLHP